MRGCLSWLLACGLTATLAGCGNAPPAPIEDHSRAATTRTTIGNTASVRTHNSNALQNYVVLRGDTLYSIAFRYGLDFRRLAAANAIAAPFTIFPGQTLVLRELEPGAANRTVVRSTPVISAKASDSVAKTSGASASGASRDGTAPSKTVTAPSVSSQPSRPSTAEPKPKPKSSASSQSTAAATRTKSSSSTTSDAPVSRWRWPAQGKLSRRFDGTLHKGIDISGARGDAVTATAGGKVVYAGSGIAGYGLMLILRHNEEYLSAYGHNASLLVAEGDTVRAGQTIATRGSSGTDSVKLHFEIRRRGRPVDPLGLLPRR